MNESDNPDGPPALSLRLDVARTGQALSSVRGAIVGLLRGARVPEEAVDDLAVVTAEACGNAVRHGSGDRYSVVVDLSEDSCEMEVVAGGEIDEKLPADTDEDPEVLRESGRGCDVMEALTDAFNLDLDNGESVLHASKSWDRPET